MYIHYIKAKAGYLKDKTNNTIRMKVIAFPNVVAANERIYVQNKN